MTSRQAGKRIASIAAQRRRVNRGGKRAMPRTAARRKEEPLSPKARRRMAQVLCCGTIFVLLVAVKLLFPGRMEVIGGRAQELLQRNMDVKAVFSAMGRGFSGENIVVSELYQAVFGPQKAEETAASSVTASVERASAFEILHTYCAGKEAENTEEATPVGVLYSEENLPEGVRMEQAILGFDYCTPVSGALSSPFGYREHPVEGEDRFHYGIDLAAESGTAVACFADGTVSAVGESSSYGKYCIVHHENGYATLYAHCSRITASSGAQVKKGETIAQVGQTGMATGAHLHFELQQGGTYLNPIYYVAVL